VRPSPEAQHSEKPLGFLKELAHLRPVPADNQRPLGPGHRHTGDFRRRNRGLPHCREQFRITRRAVEDSTSACFSSGSQCSISRAKANAISRVFHEIHNAPSARGPNSRHRRVIPYKFVKIRDEFRNCSRREIPASLAPRATAAYRSGRPDSREGDREMRISACIHKLYS